MKKILIIEDEPNIRELVKYNLKLNGYDALEAENGIEGNALIHTEKPDLILLDIMLPGKDGYEILKDLRQEGNLTPVIMLTAKSEEIDKVLGLEIGADDYIPKPFGLRELMARIRAVLRRYDISTENAPAAGRDIAAEQSARVSGIDEHIITAGDIVIDVGRHEVTFKNKLLDLTLKEFDLLAFLAKNRGHVFSRDELLDKVWGIDYMGESRTVDVHIRHLRKKMNDEHEQYIETIRGKGYKIR